MGRSLQLRRVNGSVQQFQKTSRENWAKLDLTETSRRSTMVEIEEQSIKCFFHTLQKDWSRDFRLLVNQEEGERSTIRAEYGTIQLEPFSRGQPNQHCRFPIQRNPLTRRLNYRRSPLECARRTYMVTGLRCHISRNPEHRVVFKLFASNKRHNPTR